MVLPEVLLLTLAGFIQVAHAWYLFLQLLDILCQMNPSIIPSAPLCATSYLHSSLVAFQEAAAPCYLTVFLYTFVHK